MKAVTLPGFLESLAPTLNRHGYLAVAGLVFLEDFGVPVPGETVLIAAALYAGAGRLNILAVGAVAFSAAVLGDNVGYAIGRLGGRPLVEHFGRYVLLTPRRLDRAASFFDRQGPKIITVARFLEGLRQLNGIVAGIAEMPWPTFLAFNALGAALWVGLWATLGDLAGDHLATIYRDLTDSLLYLLIAALVGVLLLLCRALLKRRHLRGGSGPA